MTTRRRAAVLAAVCLVVLAAVAGYLVHARQKHDQAVANATPVPHTSLAAVQDVPHIVFRSTALGGDYGMVAVVPLTDTTGPRAVTDTPCDRVYAAQHELVCLASKKGVVTTYSARVLDASMHPTQTLPIAGIPSRARLSRDGAYAASTTFVAGDSYAGQSFSTRTTISQVGDSTVDQLEDFQLIHNGAKIAPTDRNFWGVTFAADDDTFYVTVAWAKHTWLARGSLSKRTVTTLHEDAECPSLSPDGKQIVYKQRGSLPPGRWRLVHYDIATGKVTPLAETRSVDDQVEWIDDHDVIYGLPRSGSQGGVDDVWQVPADGSGAPKLIIPQAWSPAVVR